MHINIYKKSLLGLTEQGRQINQVFKFILIFQKLSKFSKLYVIL